MKNVFLNYVVSLLFLTTTYVAFGNTLEKREYCIDDIVWVVFSCDDFFVTKQYRGTNDPLYFGFIQHTGEILHPSRVEKLWDHFEEICDGEQPANPTTPRKVYTAARRPSF